MRSLGPGVTGRSARRRRRRFGVRCAGAVLGVALLAVACGGSGGSGSQPNVVATFRFGDAADPVALVGLGDGRMAVGERLTGRIVAVDRSGRGPRQLLATVDVAEQPKGQRGLLGVAAIGESLYASWTRAADGRLVVAQVLPGPQRLVWEGPPSSDLANGGHLAVDHSGLLLIGIGDLQAAEKTPDPTTPNGKLLALDPAGPPGQQPTDVRGGWNNPFGFTVLRDGTVWVADNAPGTRAERIGPVRGEQPLTDLPGKRAPSALVQLGPDRLGLCGYLTGDLVEVRTGPPPRVGKVLMKDWCRTGAAALGDGDVAVSDGDVVRIVHLDPT